jgi:hypothetical protein
MLSLLFEIAYNQYADKPSILTMMAVILRDYKFYCIDIGVLGKLKNASPAM